MHKLRVLKTRNNLKNTCHAAKFLLKFADSHDDQNTEPCRREIKNTLRDNETHTEKEIGGREEGYNQKC